MEFDRNARRQTILEIFVNIYRNKGYSDNDIESFCMPVFNGIIEKILDEEKEIHNEKELICAGELDIECAKHKDIILEAARLVQEDIDSSACAVKQ